jgi:cold shock CspA family protein
MLQVYRGRVKFFKRDKGYGFIIPTERGGRNVFLHAKYYSGVSNDFHGELELAFGDEVMSLWKPGYREPQTREEVVYCEYEVPNNDLMAIHWTFAKTWDRAQFMMNLFHQHGDGFIRVMRSGMRENRYRPTLIWKGTYNEFVALLDGQGFNPIDFDDSVYTEELGIDSKWTRSWHDPRNWHPRFKKHRKTPIEDILKVDYRLDTILGSNE